MTLQHRTTSTRAPGPAAEPAQAATGHPKRPATSRWPARVFFIDSPSTPSHPGQAHGLEVARFPDAISALIAMAEEPPAAIIAPTDMAHVDFPSFVATVVQRTEIPLIVGLGVHDGSGALAYEAMALGARAILTLPCTAEQLAAAMHACGIRRDGSPRPLTVGAITLDADAFRVTVAGAAVPLTAREFLLVQVLMQASPRVVGAEELSHVLSTYDDGTVNAIRALVLRVRRKFEAAAPGMGELVETVRSVGYRIAPA